MIKVLLTGCNGKMGTVITRLVKEREDCEIVAGIDLVQTSKGYPVYEKISDFNGKADVIIDFSHPSTLDDLLAYCIRTKTPAVVATTGLTTEQIEKIKVASKSVALFFSGNMSLGINLLAGLLKKAATVLGDGFDIEIIEKHHNQKIDAPSGTALMLADAVSDAIAYSPVYTYDRHSVRKKRDKKEIGIHTIRGGTIVGEHEVIFAGTDEIISLKHIATSKEVFAVGAVKAALFLSNKNAGLYDMSAVVSQ